MTEKNIPVVITGATGFLGQYLTQECLNRGLDVFIITRDVKKTEQLFRDSSVKVIGASLTDVGSLKKIPKYSRVFHCAALTGAIQASQNSYQQVNVVGTINLLEASIKQKAVSFTFVSSVSAVGAQGSLNNPITEQTTAHPKTYYGESKLAAEKMIFSVAPTSLPITIIRPPLIYGAGQSPSSGVGTLFRLCKKSVIPIIGDLDSQISLAYVKNVSSGMIDLTFSHSGREIFNIADNDSYTIKKLSHLLRESHKKRFLRVPTSLTFIASVTSEGISHLLKKDVGLRSEILKALSENGFMMNIDKALKFGYRPKETLEIIREL